MASRTLMMKRLVYIWVVAAAFLAVSINGTAAQSRSGETAVQPKKILILYSFGPRFQPWATWSQEIDRELNRQSPWPLDIQEQSLVTALNGDADAEVKFVEYLKALFHQRPPDLIVTIGAPAAHFVQQHRATLFPTTPMLLAVIEVRRFDPSTLSEQDAVVALRADPVVLFENILRLLPETKAIAIIVGNSPNERFWAAEHQRDWSALQKNNKVELIFYNKWTFEAILREIARLPPHTAIFYQQMVMDVAGAVYGDKEPLKHVYEVANAPIFSFDESYFNAGVVGGPMWSPTAGARTTAAAAVRILGGEKPADIKVPPIEFSAPKYDWRQLQRWSISESRLPPESEIVFREPSVWQRYSWQITLIVAVILFQAGFIAMLLREHRRRQHAEVQSRQRMTELAHVNRFATAGELTASIAHEINQPLGFILANAETAQEILKSQNSDIAARPDIVELKDIVNDILRDDQRASEIIRRMRSLLKKAPFELKSFDLNDVARETLGFFSSLAVGRKFELTSVITSAALPILGDRIQLQQVILNLVMNGMDAIKDSSGENRVISIRTSRVGNFAEISVSDRGPGIPEDKLKEIFVPFFTSKPEGMGMGLSIARTIVEAHHGLIWAKNRDHGGASFRIKLPIVE
jgi:signal transduction histidine kinase/ABC-type uncharacterized transport system substrate-binding protein